jgi:hypothetical protein
MKHEEEIHIYWTGPVSHNDLQSLKGPSDKGIYCVYGHHPMYGKVLVYIGKTHINFASRTVVEDWVGGSENDPNNVEYYLGRLIGRETPSLEEWKRQIIVAEALLIHAHAPAYCSQHIKQVEKKIDVSHARVHNWGAVRSLHREVSGLTWTKRSDDFKRLPPYGTRPKH